MKILVYILITLIVVGGIIWLSTPKEKTISKSGFGSVADRDCGDFGSQQEAQTFFEESLQKYGYDYHRLDGNKDGMACESLK